MEWLKKDTAWFLSAEGEKAYRALPSLEERTLFIYAYLRTVAHKSYETDNALMRIAFLLADGVAERSDAPYKNYPDLLSAEKNPILTYLSKAKQYPGLKPLFVVLLVVLHGEVDPADTSAWIYDAITLQKTDFATWLADQGTTYLPENGQSLVNADLYDIDEDLSFVQTLLMWLFLKGGQA